jgi:hypothetical protein
MAITTSLLVSATLAGVGAAATVGKMAAESSAAQATLKGLELQRKQSEVQYQQKTLANYDLMEKVLDAQKASAGVKGFALSSPSFNAIQRETYNVGTREQKNIEIEKNLAQANIAVEKENVKKSLFSSLFGDVLGLASIGQSLFKSIPTKTETTKTNK